MLRGDTVLLFCICLLLSAVWLWRKRAPRLPPGPNGWPVIGNLFDMPSEREWFTWARWGKQYGSITYLSVIGRPILIVNDFATAQQLLNKRSGIYSDRPPPLTMHELSGWGKSMSNLRYGSDLRLARKLVHKVMGSSQMIHVQNVQEEETRRFLQKLSKTPEEVFTHIHDNIASIVLRVTYGYRTVLNDPLVAKVEEAVDGFNRGASSAFLVNIFPILRYLPSWMPGTSFKHTARKFKESVIHIANQPLDSVKEQMIRGDTSPSFVSTHLSAGENQDIVKWSAASLYTAGSDTTVISLEVFFKAMIMYPKVQERAQAELDAHISSIGRLPSLVDRSQGKLPYIEAVLWEVLRWHTAVPSGAPHAPSQDDEYNGWLIPKGAIVFVNLWYALEQLAHDPSVYPNPDTFDPERFLGSNPQQDPREIVFGFGRRVCVGRYLSEASMFLTIAMTLAAFNISKVSENDVVTAEQVSGLLSRTSPFKCSIPPRNERALALLKSSLPE
ncbi:cytochrome P450 [Hymenopellis radicata]|nr:cytochrome P450 [Hymenopellis radicata]